MLITVTTSSQTLAQILTGQQKTYKDSVRDKTYQSKMIIQILGSNTVYLESGSAATVLTGIKLVQGNSFSIDFYEASEIHLIAEGGNNADVRVVFS